MITSGIHTRVIVITYDMCIHYCMLIVVMIKEICTYEGYKKRKSVIFRRIRLFETQMFKEFEKKAHVQYTLRKRRIILYLFKIDMVL